MPQANKDDVVIYRDFVDLDFSIEQQRAGEVEWTAALLGANPLGALALDEGSLLIVDRMVTHYDARLPDV